MSWTAFGQQSTDSVKISRDQQRQCIKWYGELQIYQDSILPSKDSIILIQDVFIKNTESQMLQLDQNLSETIREKDETIKKLSRTRKITIGVGITGVLGWILLFLR